MRISEAKELLASIVVYNMEQYAKGAGAHTFVVPMFEGDPGLGKTAIPRQVAREMSEKLEMGDFHYGQAIIAQFDAGEMAGLPFRAQVNIGEDKDGNPILEDQMLRLRPSWLPHFEFGVFNMDELPQAFLANQNVASQFVNEYRVGEHEISHGITVCCTGNKPENKAGTTTMPTHLRDRLAFISIEANVDDWLAYAAEHGVDFRIRAYIRNNPAHLHKFQPGAKANPTPRSWEKASAILSMGLSKTVRAATLQGQIGEGEATHFEAYLRVEDELPNLSDILKDPMNAPVFGNDKAHVLYMLLANLADIADSKNIEPIIKYIERLPNQEFAAYWAHDTFRRDKSLMENKHVTKWTMEKGVSLLY